MNTILIYEHAVLTLPHLKSLQSLQPHEHAGDGERWVTGNLWGATRDMLLRYQLQHVHTLDVDSAKLGPLRKLSDVQLRHTVQRARGDLRAPQALILTGVPPRGWRWLSRRYRRNLRGLLELLHEAGTKPWLRTRSPWPGRLLPWSEWSKWAVVVFEMPEHVTPEDYMDKLWAKVSRAGIEPSRVAVSVPSGYLEGWQEHHRWAREYGVTRIIADER